MNRLWLVAFVFVTACSARYNIAYYGNESSRPAFSSDSANLFFDSGGFVYPDTLIDNTSFFLEKEALLSNYYASAAQYNAVAKKYGLASVSGSPTKEAAYALNEAIKDEWATRVNAQLANYDRVIVLVHGYNNTYHELIGPYSLFQNRIDALTEGRNFYINVFWDGMTDNVAKDISKGESIFYTETGGARAGINNLKIWRRAQHQALFAGMELRSLLRRLQTDSLTLVSHSLGARVVASALFDIKPEDDWKKPSQAQQRYLNKLTRPSHNPTPQQAITAGMMAPAVGGKETFDDYFFGNATFRAADSTNYRFVIGYNERDEVLRKFDVFGKRSANFLGDTSFGTMRNDIDSVMNLFAANGQANRMDTVNFTKTYRKQLQNKHSMIYYLDNPSFNTFIQKVLQD